MKPLGVVMLSTSGIATLASTAFAAVDIPAGSEKGILEIFLDKGILGAIVIILAIAYVRKDKQVDELREAWRKDQKEAATELQEVTEEYAKSMGAQLVTTATVASNSTNGLTKMADFFTRHEQREEAARIAREARDAREDQDEDERRRQPRPRRPGSIARDDG